MMVRMTNRERTLAILNYEKYDRLPLIHFGFWKETVQKWFSQGHITRDEMDVYHGDGSPGEKLFIKKLGFDFNWMNIHKPNTDLHPFFETKVLEELPDGFKKVVNGYGVVELHRDGAGSIPAEVDHLLKGRKDWEELYLPRLQFSFNRVGKENLETLKKRNDTDIPLGLFCGSLFGQIRNWIGVEGVSYLYADDEELYNEIIDTVGNLTYNVIKEALDSGVKFDFAHFWEDICFKNGPLVVPSVFNEKVGPHYKRVTDLVKSYGINIISLDCDGFIDSLIPTWLENGVNTMFPIEVGTWGASIQPWRKKYGEKIRGIGGMNKTVFARDYAAIDSEIERLKPLVELGGYIPCPDHRIAPDAEWENVQYYCDRMRKAFG